MCVFQRDRLGSASGKGRHRGVCVCMCRRNRLGGAGGKGRHRDLCVCVCVCVS